jgi:hypothetical protein
MSDLSKEENFIVDAIKKQGEGGKTIAYKKLQDICAEQFEGVRLILKKLKEKGIVEYDGMIPSFNSQITLLK